MKRGMTLIVRTVSRLLFPFMFLFGIYIVLHGHLTPGGGFPGGVIIAASIVMLLLAYGYERAQETIGALEAEVAESIGGLILVGLGLVGAIISVAFLKEVLPLGTIGNLFSAGNLPILNIGVSIKVAAGFVTIFYAMLGLRGEE
ncbi:hypothetical protein AKJ42_02495 [candidate division MSBL1 archaeon SCGC-AAA261C02]|uniref:Na+/H+ antiporter MnhB subunit-related protein domain-containing protein n=1 Tax=candidate division MSBL1 archaeon SCGC-AAA261C02 TaxID=1698272 RepID=A0A133V024_9EURY|nr:hypothetical protein AKJ42_02495 [candidate division MSBL1 archaeon SCGC-AAA261C02]